jgi:hypothetical protein
VRPTVSPTVNSCWRTRDGQFPNLSQTSIMVTGVEKPEENPETFVVNYLFDEDDVGVCSMPLPRFLEHWQPTSKGAVEMIDYEPPQGRSAWERLLDD